MTTPTPDTSREAVEQLLNRITDGDWITEGKAKPFESPYDPRYCIESWRDGQHGRVSTRVADYVHRGNAEFIAAAPGLVRALLDERGAREAAIEAIASEMEQNAADADKFSEEESPFEPCAEWTANDYRDLATRLRSAVGGGR